MLDLREYAFKLLDSAKKKTQEVGDFVTSAVLVEMSGKKFEMKLIYANDAERLAAFKVVAETALDKDVAAICVVSAVTVRKAGEEQSHAITTQRLADGFGVFKVLAVTVFAPEMHPFSIAQRYTLDEGKYQFEGIVEPIQIRAVEFSQLAPFCNRKVHRA